MDAGRVQGAAAHLPLLATTVGDGHERGVTPRQQGTDPDGPADLVGADGHQVGTAVVEADGQVGDRLHGVGVEGHPVSRATAASSATGWIVPTSLLAHMTLATATPPAARAARRVSGARCPQRSGSSQVTGTPRESSEVLDGVEHRVVLDGAGHDAVDGRILRPAGQPRALDGEVVGLGAPEG